MSTLPTDSPGLLVPLRCSSDPIMLVLCRSGRNWQWGCAKANRGSVWSETAKWKIRCHMGKFQRISCQQTDLGLSTSALIALKNPMQESSEFCERNCEFSLSKSEKKTRVGDSLSQEISIFLKF